MSGKVDILRKFFMQDFYTAEMRFSNLWNFLNSCESVQYFSNVILFVIAFAFELSAYKKTVAAMSQISSRSHHAWLAMSKLKVMRTEDF